MREKIAADIVSALEDSKHNPLEKNRINLVVREPVVIADLSRTAMPLIFVESANETREDISSTSREGLIRFNLNLYLQGDARDSVRNDLIRIVEDSLAKDPQRGGFAADTSVVEIELITLGEAAPYASVRIVVECRYCYTRKSL